ncbi:MAG: hypothetical protein M1834_007070 [Cirrosporium novae-zelandiae]|nr:MAG: hypothetical protein M1834_007070 [Cirrosporium novae-zelandiae]
MSSAITKVFLAAVAAAGAVSALPQGMMSSGSATAAAPAATNSNLALIEQLELAPSSVDRFKILLGENGDGNAQEKIVFDFNTVLNAPPTGKGGVISPSSIDNFPALVGFEISTTIGILNPCGINTPHIHPRATEFLTVIQGALDTGFILENGFTNEINTTLTKFQATIFPMGSIHFQVNPNCEEAIFVAALDSNDPGVSQIAQNFFGLNANVVNATLGFPKQLNGADIEDFRGQIPPNVALGIDNCLAKCNIKKN